jgi:hypothetical protein
MNTTHPCIKFVSSKSESMSRTGLGKHPGLNPNLSDELDGV